MRKISLKYFVIFIFCLSAFLSSSNLYAQKSDPNIKAQIKARKEELKAKRKAKDIERKRDDLEYRKLLQQKEKAKSPAKATSYQQPNHV